MVQYIENKWKTKDYFAKDGHISEYLLTCKVYVCIFIHILLCLFATKLWELNPMYQDKITYSIFAILLIYHLLGSKANKQDIKGRQ